MVKELEQVDHEISSEDKFLSQYKDSGDFIALVKAMLGPLNDLEDQIQLFKDLLPLAVAENVNLDYWGTILDSQTRPVSDDSFRALLYGLIGAYNSEGTAQDIRAIMTHLVTPPEAIRILDHNDGSFSIEVSGETEFIAKEFATGIIEIAKCLGVIFNGITDNPDLYKPYFSFVGDPGADTSGFSVVGGDDGGYYGIII
jgi:hypothetical protein